MRFESRLICSSRIISLILYLITHLHTNLDTSKTFKGFGVTDVMDEVRFKLRLMRSNVIIILKLHFTIQLHTNLTTSTSLHINFEDQTKIEVYMHDRSKMHQRINHIFGILAINLMQDILFVSVKQLVIMKR